MGFTEPWSWLLPFLLTLLLIALSEIRGKFRPYKIIVLQNADTERPSSDQLIQKIEEAWNQVTVDGAGRKLLIRQILEMEDSLQISFSVGDQPYGLFFCSKALPLKDAPQRLSFSSNISDLILQEEVRQHSAYWELSIHQTPWRSAKLSLSQSMSLIAKLVDANSLLILSPSEGSVNPLSPENRKLLSSTKSCDLITQNRYSPKFVVSPEAIGEAKAQAQETLSQFTEAFLKMEDYDYEGNLFYVRFELVSEEVGRSQRAWVAVESIDGDQLDGIICNDLRIPLCKDAEYISLNSTQIEDWIYSDGEKMNGGFSVVSPLE